MCLQAFPNILIFATGSGIAPIRALIEATDDKGGLSAGKRRAAARGDPPRAASPGEKGGDV